MVGDNRFEIDLAGVSITNPAGAAIDNQSSKTLYIVSRDGSVNNLTSLGGDANVLSAKGALFSEGQMAFSGQGELSVTSSFRNGIASDDYIFLRPGTRISVNCDSGNGLKANDGVIINGGNLNVKVSYDGGKGINSEDYIRVAGGRTTIICTGTSRLDSVPVSPEYPEGLDIVSSAGAKADTYFNISGGEFSVKCTGNDTKGIKTAEKYTQTGGSVRIVTLGEKVYASPKGIKADGFIRILGGYLYAYSRNAVPLDGVQGIEVYNYKRQKSYLVEISD